MVNQFSQLLPHGLPTERRQQRMQEKAWEPLRRGIISGMAAGWLPFFSFSLVNSLELTKSGCDLSIAGWRIILTTKERGLMLYVENIIARFLSTGIEFECEKDEALFN